MNTFLSATSALFVLAACYAAGGLLRRRTQDSWPVSVVVGMAMLSTLFFVLLSLHQARPALFIIVGAATLLCYVLRARPRMHWDVPHVPLSMVLPLLAYGVFYLPHVFTPEIGYDASGYHLGLAAEWLRSGGFPHRIAFYELLPQGMETLYAFALAVYSNSITPKLIHFACLVATVALLDALGRRLELPPYAAPAAAVIYVSCPAVGLSATSAYTDVAFALVALAALFLTIENWEESSADAWVPVGMVAGFCYGVKIPGLLVPFAVAVTLLIRRRPRALAGMLGGAAITVLPWMARSYLLTGNPMAPLMNALFPNPWFPPETDAELRKVFQFLSADGTRSFNIPADLAFRGAHLGLIGPMVLALPLGLLALARKTARMVPIAGCLLFVIYTQNLSARFLLPCFLLMILALMASVPRSAALISASCCAVVCWPPLVARYAARGTVLEGWPIQVAVGYERETDYLRRKMPAYALAELVKLELPTGSQVFDCAGLPSYYSGAITLQHWQSREMRGLHHLLVSAFSSGVRSQVGGAFKTHQVPYLTIPVGPALKVPWAADLMNKPEEWGFTYIGGVGDYKLYRAR